MEIKIESLTSGEKEIVNLEDVGAVYPDDDVIYFDSMPYLLSSAQSVVNNDLLEACKANEKLFDKYIAIFLDESTVGTSRDFRDEARDAFCETRQNNKAAIEKTKQNI